VCKIRGILVVVAVMVVGVVVFCVVKCPKKPRIFVLAAFLCVLV